MAAELREQILTGRLGADGQLPKQEELIARFGVSRPSVREAMRILETEGLVTVRRGNVGGASVHLPTPQQVAYQTSLVLHADGAALLDVATAIARIEPLCAARCAERDDRATTIVPRLEAILADQRATFDNAPTFHAHARRFHEAIAGASGSDTLALVLGALESVWSIHSADWIARAEDAGGEQPDLESRAVAQRAHERLTEAIAEGDAERAARVAHAHVVATQAYTLGVEHDRTVDADLLR